MAYRLRTLLVLFSVTMMAQAQEVFPPLGGGGSPSTITLNSGTNFGITAPADMNLGSTYTLGTTNDNLRFNALGLGTAAPTGAGMIAEAMGTITADAPGLLTTVTWNSSGVAFTPWKLNVTDSASASGSLLEDLQVGSASKFKVDKAGNQTLAGSSTTTGAVTTTSAGVRFKADTYANRPGSPVEGQCYWMTDADSGTFGANITAGSGSNHVLACYDGTNWTVH
jgi:hypothetical protein